MYQLKILRLISPKIVFCGKTVIEAVKNFPMLEEPVFYELFADANVIKAFGCSCPLLRSFVLNDYSLSFGPCDL